MAGRQEEQELELDDAVKLALEEARMVIPGIQALFGFQLVAVFNQRFEEALDEPGQLLHLAALALVALSCALAMTPAAYHRQAGRGKVSAELLELSSLFIGSAMIPLLLAIAIDIGLLAYVVTQSVAMGGGLGVSCAVVFAALWIVFPQVAKRRR
jgi:membrane protein YdbS with pleckstrin-like domain